MTVIEISSNRITVDVGRIFVKRSANYTDRRECHMPLSTFNDWVNGTQKNLIIDDKLDSKQLHNSQFTDDYKTAIQFICAKYNVEDKSQFDGLLALIFDSDARTAFKTRTMTRDDRIECEFEISIVENLVPRRVTEYINFSFT
jgi:hypothetical protein